MIHYKLTSAVIAMAIALVIIYLVRRDHMQTRYATWWLCTAATVVILGFFPQLIDFIGQRLGVHYPPTLLLTIALGFFLIKMLKMDLDRSDRERRLRRLTQRMAILEEKLEKAKKEKNK